MNKFIYILSLILVVSCAKEEIESQIEIIPEQLTSENMTRTSTRVTLSDVLNYVSDTKGNIETKSACFSIDPIMHGSDTVMFLVNYSDGWEVLSGDIRMPKTLMKCDSGSVSAEDLMSLNPSHEEYMSNLSESISDVMSDTTYYTPASFGLAWTYLDPKYHLYELVKVLISSDTLDTSISKGHLLQTQWGQGTPWNQYAPYKDSTLTSHCYTGCVPVAASQVLYYLHDKIGVPQNIYGTVQCNAYAPDYSYVSLDDTNVSFSDSSSSYWDSMPLNSSGGSNYDKVSALMVRLGYLVGAQYRRNGTGAFINDLVYPFLSEYSIRCYYNTIDNDNFDIFADRVKEEVYYDELPIIMDIQSTYTSARHCMVIDGYKEEQIRITNQYAVYKLPYNEHGYHIPVFLEPDYYETTVSDILFGRFVAINWGWDGLSDGSISSPIWYNIYNDWVVSVYSYPFNEIIAMIYGFESLNN